MPLGELVAAHQNELGGLITAIIGNPPATEEQCKALACMFVEELFALRETLRENGI